MQNNTMDDGKIARREHNLIIQFFRFVVLNLKILMMTKHKH
jgi:hypothetical protein